MKNEQSLIESYLHSNYEKLYKENTSRYELLSIIYEGLSKLNSNIEKFNEIIENKKTKDKLSSYKKDNIFYSLYLLIENTIRTSFYENFIMINKILELITNIKEIIKSSLKKYEDFLVIQKQFMSKLVELEEYKNNFLESAKNAELFTYNFLMKKASNKKTNISDFNQKDELKGDTKTKLEKYKTKINECNETLKIFNEKEKDLFKTYKELDIKYNITYSDSLYEYLEHQLIIKGLSEPIKDKIISINNENNQKKMQDILKNYKQKEEIKFTQYTTNIDFNDCKDNLPLYICFMTFNEIGECIGTYTKADYNEESQKLELNKKINKILSLNEKITDKDYDELIECLKDDLGQTLFLNSLSKLRSYGIYEKDKKFIELIGNALNYILVIAEKEKNYEKAKNCIILSQTFYYSDINKEKIYILFFIKNNKWLKEPKFWREFISMMLTREFDKASTLKKKKKINEILLTQALPLLNNMIEFDLDKRIIIKIIDEFLDEYQITDEKTKNTLFTMINCDQKIIDQLRKEYKENPDLEKKLYNESNENNNNEEKKEIIKEDNQNIKIEEHEKSDLIVNQNTTKNKEEDKKEEDKKEEKTKEDENKEGETKEDENKEENKKDKDNKGNEKKNNK